MYLKVKLTAGFMLAVAALLTLPTGTASARLKTKAKLENMSFMDLCKEFGQTCSEYEVITEDGFILTIHRIRGNEKKPVLLWHGLLDSSESFILRGENSTGVSLAAEGYDVWLGNSRGNKYGKKHINLRLDNAEEKQQFWDFSIHKMGIYDLPAVINFILYRTNQNKLSAIGHSQGTAMFYILASTRPVYNNLVQPFISMAPMAFLTNIKPMFSDFLMVWPDIESVLESDKTYEILQDNTAVKTILPTVCLQGSIGRNICAKGLIDSIIGMPSENIEPDFVRTASDRYPAGTSRKHISHFSQIYQRKRFADYDYGTVENLKKYGNASPPDYDLKNVNTSVALLCGVDDIISTLEDVKVLREKLPNVVYYKVMEHESHHMDFVWGNHINDDLNPLLKKLLNKFA